MAELPSPKEWSEWCDWLAAGLHGRNRWRLAVVMTGMLLAGGRRTVTAWLRAAAISDHFSHYYYFIAAAGRKSRLVAEQLLILLLTHLRLDERVLAVIDDSPTKRYGPRVQGADVHHNPTPGPADWAYLYGHVWVTLSLAVRHATWGTIGLPLLALLYVRRRTIDSIPQKEHWTFQTKLELGVSLVLWLHKILKNRGKTLWLAPTGLTPSGIF